MCWWSVDLLTRARQCRCTEYPRLTHLNNAKTISVESTDSGVDYTRDSEQVKKVQASLSLWRLTKCIPIALPGMRGTKGGFCTPTGSMIRSSRVKRHAVSFIAAEGGWLVHASL